MFSTIVISNSMKISQSKLKQTPLGDRGEDHSYIPNIMSSTTRSILALCNLYDLFQTDHYY